MDVEHPKLALADVPKTVEHPDRRGNPCSRASMDDVIAKPELSHALEDIERINVIQVAVWVNAESGAKANIDHFKLGRFGEYPVMARTAGDPFSLLGPMWMPDIDGVSHCSG
jgi:hypothetical protein